MDRWEARGRPRRGGRWVFGPWRRAELRYRVRRWQVRAVVAVVLLGILDKLTEGAVRALLARLLA